MDKREELLAQRAEIDAKLAALDAEREIAEIAEKVVAENHGGTPMVFAVAAIRETLRRVPAWPGDFLADGEALLIAFAEGTNWTPEKRAAYSQFASVIRRLKARMGAGGGAKIEPYIVYADDEGWFDWHGGECPVPAETRVEYKLRYGAVRAAKAWQLVWGHCANPSAYDIVAYRIIPGEEA